MPSLDRSWDVVESGHSLNITLGNGFRQWTFGQWIPEEMRPEKHAVIDANTRLVMDWRRQNDPTASEGLAPIVPAGIAPRKIPEFPAMLV
jgi:hypothetical protein